MRPCPFIGNQTAHWTSRGPRVRTPVKHTFCSMITTSRPTPHLPSTQVCPQPFEQHTSRFEQSELEEHSSTQMPTVPGLNRGHLNRGATSPEMSACVM